MGLSVGFSRDSSLCSFFGGGTRSALRPSKLMESEDDKANGGNRKGAPVEQQGRRRGCHVDFELDHFRGLVPRNAQPSDIASRRCERDWGRVEEPVSSLLGKEARAHDRIFIGVGVGVVFGWISDSSGVFRTTDTTGL